MIKDRMGRTLSTQEILKKIIIRIENYLLDFELMILRWAGFFPCSFIRKQIYQLAGITIGKGTTVHMWSNFFNPRKISIGDDTIIGDHAFLDGRATLTIGNHVNIASWVLIYNSEHDINAEDFHATYGKVIIEDYVYIGARVTILPNVKIGKGAVIASGAVVTKDVNPLTVVGGVPAQEIGLRQVKQLNYRLGRTRLFQ